MPRLPLVRLAALAAVVAFWAAPAARADYSDDQYKLDLKLLEDKGQPHTDADLVEFFRKRLITDAERDKIDGYIKKLNKGFKEREQATSDIIAAGPPALPLLRKVLGSNVDLETKKRADRCIKAIEEKSPSALVVAAARVLKHRRTQSACAILMAYLAVAPDDVVEEEIDAALFSLALIGAKLDVLPPLVKAGKLDPLFVKALEDKDASRRAIAALIVGRYGSAGERKAVAALLTDKEPAVRFRAAQGLTSGRDTRGIPVLIELLESGPMPLALQAEDLLSVVAEEKGPVVPLGEAAEVRKKCHTAWQEWYDKNKATLSLAKADVDTPFGSLVTRASNGAVAFIKAIVKFDKEMITKTTDVPFTFAGQLNFNTREEFDNFIKMIGDQRPPEQDLKFHVTKVVPAAEYAKTAPEVERGFLEAARIAQIHVVYIEITEGGGPQAALPFFVRISGGRARCLGFGNPRVEMK
jgi:hypothetical protein